MIETESPRSNDIEMNNDGAELKTVVKQSQASAKVHKDARAAQLTTKKSISTSESSSMFTTQLNTTGYVGAVVDLEPELPRSNVIEMDGCSAELKTVVNRSEVAAKVQKKEQLTRKESMSESGSLSATQLNTDGWVGAMTVNNEANEGLDKYANIERVLKAVDPDDYVYYLNNFKREKVDDATLQKIKLRYSRNDMIWGKKLIPAHGPCQDFLDVLYADVCSLPF